MWAVLPSAWRQRWAALAYAQAWRHPRNRKYIKYRNAASGGPSHGHGNTHKNLVKMGHVFPEICSRRDRQTHTHTQTDMVITILCSPTGSRITSGPALCFIQSTIGFRLNASRFFHACSPTPVALRSLLRSIVECIGPQRLRTKPVMSSGE